MSDAGVATRLLSREHRLERVDLNLQLGNARLSLGNLRDSSVIVVGELLDRGVALQGRGQLGRGLGGDAPACVSGRLPSWLLLSTQTLRTETLVYSGARLLVIVVRLPSVTEPESV